MRFVRVIVQSSPYDDRVRAGNRLSRLATRRTPALLLPPRRPGPANAMSSWTVGLRARGKTANPLTGRRVEAPRDAEEKNNPEKAENTVTILCSRMTKLNAESQTLDKE